MSEVSGKGLQSPQMQTQTHEDEIDLGYLLAVFWDHRWWIAAITAAVTLIGLCYALLATPVYQADALLQIERRDSGNMLGQLEFLTGGGPEATSSTQTQILQSRMILGQAAQQVGLDRVVEPVYLPVIGKALARYGVERPGLFAGRASVWAGESISLEELTVEAAMQGEPLTLRVTGPDSYSLHWSRVGDNEEQTAMGRAGQTLQIDNPAITLRIGEINADQGAEFRLVKRSPQAATRNLRDRFNVTEQGRDTSVLSVTLSGEDPQEIVRALDAINEVYLVQNINRQAAEAENRLAFLEEQSPQVRDSLTSAEDMLNQYRATQDSVDLSFETRSVLEQLVEIERQLNELDFEETEIAQRYTRSHPRYQSLLERRRQLNNERNRLEARVENLPSTQQEVLRMTRDVEVNQQLYMQMLNTMQELRIARAGTVGNVRIVDNAALQANPIAPRRSLIVVISFLLGGMLGLMVVMLRRMMHRGVESAEQLTAIGLPVYATVPLSENQGALARRVKRKGEKSGRAISRGVLAWTQPADLSIESLRGLRTSLHFAMMETGGNNCLMLTGSGPSVGKSFVSVNLGAVCAQSGQKVLVIDADMRKGHLHEAFGKNSKPGLSELLAGSISLDEAIVKTEGEHLDFIARGSSPPNPSELLMSEHFSRFMETVGARYDLVIIDTPPVLAVTDAAIVGRHVGSSFMVVRFRENSVRELERTLQSLDTAGVKVNGAILNAIERSAAASYGYGYGYYGYYSYDKS